MKIKYPRLLLLLLSLFFAYALFANQEYLPFHNLLLALGYMGIFLAGFLYAYGFTAAPAMALLLIMAKEYNFLAAVLLGGLGALLSDLFIFFFIKSTFTGEIKKLSKTKLVKRISKEEKKIFGHFQKYLTAVFAGFLIASPFPTEIGVTLMASSKEISTKKFVIIAYLLHTFGIFVILAIGNLF